MASLTTVGDKVSLSLTYKGDVAAIALSGTYDMTIALQREIGSKGSGAFETLKTWDTADATVAYNHVATRPDENLQVIVLVDNSGTCVATITDAGDVLLETVTDEAGNVVSRRYEGGGVVLADAVVLLADANASIKAADSGKIHVIANVSADRTFTLPAGFPGANYSFRAQVGAADGHDWIFATAAATELFAGGVLMVDTDAGPATVAAVVADQSNDDAFQVNVPQGATRVDMAWDGTYWVVSGVVLSTAAAVFS